MENRNYYPEKDRNDYKKLAIDFIKKWMPDFYVTCKCGELNSKAVELCTRCGKKL